MSSSPTSPSKDGASSPNYTLEVCVDNFGSVVKAAEGGAHRIELCSALSEGGLTPSVGLLIRSKSAVSIPLFSMIRPRCGDFVYSDQEIEIMKLDIRLLKLHGADGFVFGVLEAGGRIHEEHCRALIKEASPLPCTFHRAFDLIPHPHLHHSLQTIISLGFSRLLTSGQKGSALQGIGCIRELVELAEGSPLSIMGGAGVSPDNVGEMMLKCPGLRELHASAKERILSASSVSGPSMGHGAAGEDASHYEASVEIVRKIVQELEAGGRKNNP